MILIGGNEYVKRVLSSIVAVAMFATMAISASAEAGQGITNGNDMTV